MSKIKGLYMDEIERRGAEIIRLRNLLKSVIKSRHWPEEGQAWGFLLSEKLYDTIEDEVSE